MEQVGVRMLCKVGLVFAGQLAASAHTSTKRQVRGRSAQQFQHQLAAPLGQLTESWWQRTATAADEAWPCPTCLVYSQTLMPPATKHARPPRNKAAVRKADQGVRRKQPPHEDLNKQQAARTA